MRMRTVALILVTFAVGAGFGIWTEGRRGTASAQSAAPANGFAAVPGAIGSQDLTGPYEVVKGWPKDISTLPGNEKWTYGAGESVFAESPNRVFMLFRGELPKMAPPRNDAAAAARTQHQLPGRRPLARCDDGVAARRRRHRSGHAEVADGVGRQGRHDRHQGPAVPASSASTRKWEHCIVVADANGNIVETWTQWDKLLRRPHSVYISPYDPEKHVWVVDDNMQVIYKFTHDGKQLVQTIGTPEQEGADATHFNRPTFIDWLPDGTFFVSDGYTGTRVAKFDKNGKFLMDWGIKGNPPNETRPGYMNNVHGVAVDPVSRHVFVNDRNNHRVQVFDENGKYLYDWKIDADPSSLHLLYIGADRNIWTFDRSTHKMLKYDQQGHLLYAWGTLGHVPRRAVGRPRHERRPGGQPVRRRSGQRPRAEVRPEEGRAAGVPGEQARRAECGTRSISYSHRDSRARG